MSETIHFEEKEYRAYEAIAKKTGFETVEELVNTAIREFIKTTVIEKESVTILIPKKLLKLVKVLRSQDWEEYLSRCLTDTIAADIIAEAFGEFDEVTKDFGLTEEFQFYEGH
ncbi:unnamed protein product [marine sediment metagenome]|uniref:Uncharacterized protein n=1 Tax=marine sediment metagenome TaxID=412755 RepID=X1KSY3_9ZZZZ